MIFEVAPPNWAALDNFSSYGHVMAKGYALSVYFYARFGDEVIPWGRVKLHDEGKFCHCPHCQGVCIICRAERVDPRAPKFDEHGSRLYNNKYGPYGEPTQDGPERIA